MPPVGSEVSLRSPSDGVRSDEPACQGLKAGLNIGRQRRNPANPAAGQKRTAGNLREPWTEQLKSCYSLSPWDSGRTPHCKSFHPRMPTAKHSVVLSINSIVWRASMLAREHRQTASGHLQRVEQMKMLELHDEVQLRCQQHPNNLKGGQQVLPRLRWQTSEEHFRFSKKIAFGSVAIAPPRPNRRCGIRRSGQCANRDNSGTLLRHYRLLDRGFRHVVRLSSDQSRRGTTRPPSPRSRRAGFRKAATSRPPPP
jgi:hypothetical protein